MTPGSGGATDFPHARPRLICGWKEWVPSANDVCSRQCPVIDLDLGFKPPTGLGLAVTTPGGSPGAGSWALIRSGPNTAGCCNWSWPDPRPQGLGLLSPLGCPMAAAAILDRDPHRRGFAPIPLGLGFTLTGIRRIGGPAPHRPHRRAGCDGLKTGTLNSVFPPDPLRECPRSWRPAPRSHRRPAAMSSARWSNCAGARPPAHTRPGPARRIAESCSDNCPRPSPSPVAGADPSARADSHGCPRGLRSRCRNRLSWMRRLYDRALRNSP